MSRNDRCALAASLALILLLGGCGQSGTPSSRDRETHRVPASTSHKPGARAGAKAQARVPDYDIDIQYPSLPDDEAALLTALHRSGEALKRDFVKAVPKKLTDRLINHPLQLRMSYTVPTRTDDLVSVLGQGISDTGGAHPTPIEQTFLYDIHAGRVIGLDDLFTDPAAVRKALADNVRPTLERVLDAKRHGGTGASAKGPPQGPPAGPPKGPPKGPPQSLPDASARTAPARAPAAPADPMQQMLEQGTTPTVAHFSRFLLRASRTGPSPGISLVFPPAQVAPYVYGTQIVFVPARVFEKWLKPQYRDAFVH